MAKEKEIYRLNCVLSADIGDKLGVVSKETGLAKVVIVAQALNLYFTQHEMQKKLVEAMSDPLKLAEVSKVLGMELPRQ